MSKIDWSKAPEGATHAAITTRNRVCWYKDVDKAVYCCMYAGKGEGGWIDGSADSPCHTPLERRPEEKSDVETAMDIALDLAIADHEPQWVPGETLPPVGTECEVNPGQNYLGEWYSCRIVGEDDGQAVFKSLTPAFPLGIGYFSATPAYFRAVKSHRDKVIEAAMGCSPKDASAREKDMLYKFSECLFICEMLKLPEGE